MAVSKLRKGDKVRVISGGSKGVIGQVLSIDYANQKVVIEGVNMIERHYKPDARTPRGHSKKIARPIAISNVAIVDPSDSNKTSRIGYSVSDKGVKNRIYKSNGKEIA